MTTSTSLSRPSTYAGRDRELDLRWWAAANDLTVAQIRAAGEIAPPCQRP